jgi:hypothetical protein
MVDGLVELIGGSGQYVQLDALPKRQALRQQAERAPGGFERAEVRV